MILYYNRNGQLLESLTYGNAPRVGSNNFKIFAYFEGINDYSEYEIATIKFRRPGLHPEEYPTLFMVQKSFVYDSLVENSDYFNEQNNPYQGFIFDFSTITDNDEPTILLDRAGQWQASITLISNTARRRNVTGMITFYVEGSVSPYDDEPEQLSDSEIISNIITVLSTYAPKNKTITVVADITTTDITNDDIGRVYLSKSNGMFYQKVGPENEYEPFDIFSNMFMAGETTTFKEIADIGKPVFVKYGGHYYLLSSIEPGTGYYVFVIFDLINPEIFFSSKTQAVPISSDTLFKNVVASDGYFACKFLLQDNTTNTVYAIDNNGQQIHLGYSELVINDKIVKRTSTGQIKVPSEPIEDNDAAGKGYVDEKYNDITTHFNFVIPSNSWSEEENGVFTVKATVTLSDVTLRDNSAIEAYFEDISVSAGVILSSATQSGNNVILVFYADVAKEDDISGVIKYVY